MKKIAIIGSGGLGREILGIIESINRYKQVWDFVGFYDDTIHDTMINGYSIIGNIESLNSLNEDIYIVIGIGNPVIKERIHQKISNPRVFYPVLIHPSVIIYSENTVKLGKGVVIGANCVLTVNISISEFVYLNTASIISHDTTIGDYSMIMPTVSISAGATLGKRVYIGNGTKIDYPLEVVDDTIIKAGSVLCK